MPNAYTVILALLSIGSVALGNNLENNLKEAAIEAKILINKVDIQFFLEIAEAVESNKIAPEEDIEKWHGYASELRSWNVTIEEDYLIPLRRIVSHIPVPQLSSTINTYLNGGYSKFESDMLERSDQQYTSFKIRATNIINDAKNAGYTNEILNNKLNAFRYSRNHYALESNFNVLLSYLNGLNLN
ncbi:uncharacterized protein LOC133834944 [Drosophila sulfurigaster albostrigata]|uniref:uncharacterized protein LOC133834944 n=1 Tax=Drosophila sulfurigaster albostrigata TaxID=89887 RepID=UPI002D21ACB3|nr:uncharacterized protein LOC133834944 [Drosophila sulfurigaster albostrigata]